MVPLVAILAFAASPEGAQASEPSSAVREADVAAASEPASKTAPASHMTKGVPLTVGYFGPYVIHPGIRLGTYFPVKSWTTTKARRHGDVTRTGSLFVGPQLGFFARPHNHLSVMASGEFGYRTQRHGRSFHSAFALGAGYLAAFQVVTIAVELGDGSKTKTREMRNYFVPMVSYAFGHDVRPWIGWFFKLSYGQKFSVPIESSAMFMLEVGVSFRVRGRAS